MEGQSYLLLGDEAIAAAALHAGIGGAFSYPGTPATEVFETVQHLANTPGPPVWAKWSPNEKVAYEEALGMSYAGRRALVSMKHVGLNVAADPFVNSGLTGTNGGLVLVVADDPGMHSSQNEQDSRFYAQFAKIPCLEPASQQEAYDSTLAAFELSERFAIPVMVRVTTRLAHSRSTVATQMPVEERPEPMQRPMPDPGDWTLVPSQARKRFQHLLGLQPALREWSESLDTNRLVLAGPRGVIACGIGWNYLAEAIEEGLDWSFLRICSYPPPLSKIRQIVDHCDSILVIEDGYPLVEAQLNGLLGVPGKAVNGRLTGHIPPDGELNPDVVARALGIKTAETQPVPEGLAGRPPMLCKGCPHADTFRAITDATAPFQEPGLFSDIGCYTLGAFPPYRAVKSCVDMGASIAMAHGASRAGVHPVLCTIGDSTFAHSGIGPLLSAAASNADMTVVILDNATVAMTGAQETFLAGDKLVDVVKGIGVSDVTVIEPLPKNHEANVKTLSDAIGRRGLSVIVSRRPCIQIKVTQPEKAQEGPK